MDSLSRDQCTLCTEEDLSNHAINWCTECEVFLCTECEKHHKRSKASKEHNTMSTNDYWKSMHETSNRCKDHDKKYDIYCAIHSCPCCVQCVTEDHQKCQDLKPLADILKDVKSSANIPILKKELDDLKDSFETLVNVLEDRIEIINLQKTKGIEEVRSMRKLLDDYLDKLERQMIDELESKHSKMKTDTELLVKQMEYRSKLVDRLIDEFSTITQYATELQTYIGLREIENTASKESQYLEELDSGGQLDNQNLEITFSPALQSRLQEVQSFGHISFKSSPHGIQVMTGRKDQAQNLVPVVHSIKQMKSLVEVALNVPNSERFQIYACQILPDSTFLLLDRTEKCLIQVSNNGVFMHEVMALNEIPYDMCFVKDNTVAVTLSRVQKVVLIDVEKHKLIQDIELSYECFGISSDGEVLVISHAMETQILVYNLDNMSSNILEGIDANQFSLFKGIIYGTNRWKNSFKLQNNRGTTMDTNRQGHQ